MTSRVVLHEEAEAEAQRGVLHYLDEADDPTVAMRFEAAIGRALADVADSPERWPIVDADSRERVYLFARPFNAWMLIYRIDGTTVHVVAIAHTKRRPDYWRHRR
ncbi:MAG: type II toxin-antitoxin system RelE/ParE family toxin [Sandaracinaceae bacterium]